MAKDLLSPMTPAQVLVSEEFSEMVGKLFLKHHVSREDGIRMLGTMLTWLAIQDGLSGEEVGTFMKGMHETISRRRTNEVGSA